MCIMMLGSAGPIITVSRMYSIVVLHLTVGASSQLSLTKNDDAGRFLPRALIAH